MQDINAAEPKLNGIIYALCKILKNIITSVAEYEVAVAFENGQDDTIMQRVIIELGHLQLPTPTKVDNTASPGFTHRILKENRIKTTGMKYYYVKEREQKNRFILL